ncbi:phage head closure protein [Metabacillus fastidiosus]|uniref:phage head closure protein n=1 Tax=Metabacillus fastidiosus TaxID=1458 RepID=UPI000824FF91|nr:phage head closure protein [Metabacillus fastidiosus]MED4461859.1 phage head closure protein [Metabacillus fastidiosus]
MLHDEFPHEVTIQELASVSDGGGGHKKAWTTFLTMEGFMDTPTSKERYEAMQLNNPLDRYLYYPYRTDIKTDMRAVFEEETYEIVGRPEDQGGQHEIIRLPLKLVQNG